jgi:plastocyanin
MRATVLTGAAVLALTLAACGNDDDGAAPAPEGDESTIVARGNDQLQWDQDRYEVTAGDIDVVLINDGNVPHTLLIEDADGEDMGIKLSVGRRDDGSIELQAGQYVLWCDVPGHRQAGMESDLVVTE